jgi:hypothetical protein
MRRAPALAVMHLLLACGSSAEQPPDAAREAATDAPAPDAGRLDASEPPDAPAPLDAPPDAPDCGPGRRWTGSECVCAAGLVTCGGACVDTATSGLHCGACGRACDFGVACVAGRCEAPPPDAAVADAPPPPDVCASMTPGNCCGVGCPRGMGVMESTCIAGRCGFVCEPWAGDCDRNPANGCETDLTATSAHCGGCGMACAGGGRCVRSVCPPTCPAGRGNCDGNNDNGCEADLAIEATNCGACGARCGDGRPCAMGRCR